MTRPQTPSRRVFLRGFAGALLSLPVLEACGRIGGGERTGRASQALAAPAKRLVVAMAPDGVVPEYWFPTGSEKSFVLGRHLKLLEPFQDRLLLMKGVDNKAAKNFSATNGHIEGVTSFLTGLAPYIIDQTANLFTGAGKSIDQVIVETIVATGFVSKVKSVHFGEEGVGGYSSIAYADAQQPMDIMSTNQAFTLLFEDASQSEAAILEARALKKSILDGTIEDFTRLQARVSGEDKKRIDAHLEAVRDIEKSLDKAAICKQPALTLDPADDDERRKLFYDLLVAAMTCDATRVATLSFHHSGGGGPQLPFVEVYEDIHELSHQIVDEPIDGPSHTSFDKYHQWYCSKTLYFLQKMQEVLLPDGSTLLDETVFLQGSEISFNHDTPNMPYMLIAGAKTPFDTGRYVELAPSVPHNHLLVTLARAFGADIAEFGDPMFAAGNLDAKLLKSG